MTLCTGLSRCDPPTAIHTERTSPSLPARTETTRPIGQRERGESSSMMRTRSFSRRLSRGDVHFTRSCRVGRKSALHRDQNSLARCWTRRHLLLQYRSARPNSPGGGNTTSDFRVRIWFGQSGGVVSSVVDSTGVRGRQFTMHSASVMKVRKSSSSNWSECDVISAVSVLLADCIIRSHTPPMWLAWGTFRLNLT